MLNHRHGVNREEVSWTALETWVMVNPRIQKEPPDSFRRECLDDFLCLSQGLLETGPVVRVERNELATFQMR